MININLVPQHLRKRRKLSILPVAFLNLPREAVVGLIGGLFVILFVVHIILQFVIFVKLFQYGKYQRQWNRVRPDKMKVDLVVKKMQSLQSKIDSIKNITTDKRIVYSTKLNAISDSLPRGVWLQKIRLDEDTLFIEGSAVSKIEDEMISVGNFAANLKKHENFMMNLANIELGSIQRRKIQSIEIADFSITAKMQ